MNYTFFLLNKFYSKDAPKRLEIDESTLIKIIRNPKPFKDKLMIPGWNFCHNEPEKIDRSIEKPTHRRVLNTGFTGTSVLLLDFDNKDSNSVSIEQVCMFFRDYKFFLYTSFNNTKKVAKFRVILPLDRFYPKIVTEFIRKHFPSKDSPGIKIIQDFFLVDDRTCFENARYFTGPAKNVNPPKDPENPYQYQFKVNDGKLFSFSPITQYILKASKEEKELLKRVEEKAKLRKEEKSKKNEFGIIENNDKDTEPAIRYAKREISYLCSGEHHKTWLRISSFLKHVGLEGDQIYEILEPSVPSDRKNGIEELRRIVFGG